MKGLLLDADYETKDGKAWVRLFLKNKRGIIAVDDSFLPYIYLIPEKDVKASTEKVKGIEVGEVKVRDVEIVKRKQWGNEIQVLKIILNHPQDVPKVREAIKGLGVGEVAEHDILFVRRYIIDKGIVPMGWVEVKGREKDGEIKVQAISTFEEEYPPLKVMAFDIEVYNPRGSPRENKDPIIMVSLATNTGIKKVLTWKKPAKAKEFIEVLDGEAGILKRFEEIVKEENIDILVGYNTDQFDLPYIKNRLKKLNIDLALGRDGSGIDIEKARGIVKASIRGRPHIDLYPIVRRSVRLSSYVLEDVVKEVLGIQKEKLKGVDMFKYWDEGGEGLERLIRYSMEDAEVTLKLGEKFLPLYYELARLVKLPLYDVARMTVGQLVEWLLIREAYIKKEIVPSRGIGAEFVKRAAETYVGGYVKEPKKGISEDIVVFDFRSLYPSIIVTHNIDPSTFRLRGCEENSPPDFDYCFSMDKPGFIPEVLKRVLKRRAEVKDKMRQAKGEVDLRMLDFEQSALKILANSFYGYMGYPRARWYKRECAESATSWARDYIKKVMGIAEEEFGLEVVYGDTDSLFVLVPRGMKGKELRFLNHVNKSLPGILELEYEGFYKRGIFVTKKRYALIDEKDKVTVKGLEFVRRDWAPIARVTQQQVLETILKDGDPKKAAQIVKETIKRVRERKISLEDIAIYTQLSRRIESYINKGAHVIAAQKMRKKGREVGAGSIIGYVITKGTKMISQRAEPVEDVTIEDYDADYYIENQILPSVIRIMESLGYSKTYLKEGLKQEGLERWF